MRHAQAWLCLDAFRRSAPLAAAGENDKTATRRENSQQQSGRRSVGFLHRYAFTVMLGLDPGIHRKSVRAARMDCRVKPGNDGKWECAGAEFTRG
jgi:hypothetical protein